MSSRIDDVLECQKNASLPGLVPKSIHHRHNDYIHAPAQHAVNYLVLHRRRLYLLDPSSYTPFSLRGALRTLTGFV